MTQRGTDECQQRRRTRINERRETRVLITIATPVFAYSVVFGGGITASLGSTADRGRILSGAPQSTGALLTDLAFTVLIALVAVAALRVRRRRWPGLGQWPWASRRLPPAPTVVGAVGVVVLMFAVGDVLLWPLLWQFRLMNVAQAQGGMLAEWTTAVKAGIGEELLALAIPVTVLRFYRAPTLLAIPLLIMLRCAYHLYYGVPGVLWLFPWAVASAVIYWKWRDLRILSALILFHIIFDARSALFGNVDGWVLTAVATAALIGAFAADPRWWRAPAPWSPSTTPMLHIPTRSRPQDGEQQGP